MQRHQRRREPVQHREDRGDDERQQYQQQLGRGNGAHRSGDCVQWIIAGTQPHHVGQRQAAKDAGDRYGGDGERERDVDGADDHQRHEVRALESLEQMGDAQRLVAGDGMAPEHESAHEHRRQQPMPEIADVRHEADEHRDDDVDDHDADPRPEIGREDAPAFGPPGCAAPGLDHARFIDHVGHFGFSLRIVGMGPS